MIPAWLGVSAAAVAGYVLRAQYSKDQAEPCFWCRIDCHCGRLKKRPSSWKHDAARGLVFAVALLLAAFSAGCTDLTEPEPLNCDWRPVTNNRDNPEIPVIIFCFTPTDSVSS